MQLIGWDREAAREKELRRQVTFARISVLSENTGVNLAFKRTEKGQKLRNVTTSLLTTKSERESMACCFLICLIHLSYFLLRTNQIQQIPTQYEGSLHKHKKQNKKIRLVSLLV